MTQNDINQELNSVFAEIFGDVLGVRNCNFNQNDIKEERTMTDLNKVEMMVEREELLSKIKVYNIKAESMGLETIQVGSSIAAVEPTATEKIRDLINGRSFSYHSDARKFLMEVGFKPVGSSTAIYQKDNCIVSLVMKDLKYVIVTR